MNQPPALSYLLEQRQDRGFGVSCIYQRKVNISTTQIVILVDIYHVTHFFNNWACDCVIFIDKEYSFTYSLTGC